MQLPEPDRISNDVLMLWIIHQFAEEFRDHALLKGGMQLMLLSSDRATNDLDYVFSPYASKKDVEPGIDKILGKIPGARIQKSMHSNSGRYQIRTGKAAVQIEYNVAERMPSATVTTQLLAQRVGALPRVIRVMSSDVAFAHKLAAWNERRLLRDLYDCYYWYVNVKVMPNAEVLQSRLKSINSRLPGLKKVKMMTMEEFFQQLETVVNQVTELAFLEQLSPLLPRAKLEGLFPVFQAQIRELIGELRRSRMYR